MKKAKRLIWGIEMATLILAFASCGTNERTDTNTLTMTASIIENDPIVEIEDIGAADTTQPC